jgi:hypothetical protein
MSDSERRWETNRRHEIEKCADFVPVLDLLAEDSWRSVYAGELEVRPPAAPTFEAQLSVTNQED